MVARDLAEYREREAAGGGIKDILYEMIDASAPIAVQSGLCGYWDPGYWQIKVIEASVATDVPDLSDRFKAASLKEVERLQQDPSDRMPCGSGLQELALMYLTDLSMISDDY